MKTFNVIAKVLAALVAAAGVVYVVATYGEQIVAWAKRKRLPKSLPRKSPPRLPLRKSPPKSLPLRSP